MKDLILFILKYIVILVIAILLNFAEARLITSFGSHRMWEYIRELFTLIARSLLQCHARVTRYCLSHWFGNTTS